MAVTVETLEKLERKITLSVPVTVIQKEVDTRLKRLARTGQDGRFPSRQGAHERGGPALRLLGAVRSAE